MSLITCENLTLGYEGKAILSGLNFSVNSGDYLCIVGENGSGKSTLMKTLLHLQSPMSGSIILGDDLKINEIGYLPQQTALQRDFPASVDEIVMSGFLGRMGLRPFYNKAEKKEARELMEKTRITDLADRCYRQLSGGQQQRVLLTRALCATRKILLLDEPVSGLDPVATADMYQIINELNKEDRVTIIMISHDISEVATYASHVLHIGQKVFFRNKRGISGKQDWKAACGCWRGGKSMSGIFEKLAFYFQYPFVWYALIVGVLIALCSSLLGVTLVLKRFSFIGDGLSHVAFGAMAIASVLNFSNNMLFVMPVTVICAVLLLRTGQSTKIKGDAAIAMISVGALAVGYLLMNIFSTGSNISGDVCSSLFGSTSILTLTTAEVWLCVVVSVIVVALFTVFYHKIFAVTFDENFAKATGTRTDMYNLLIAVITAVIIVLAMNLVGSLLISALIIFPALSAMRLYKRFSAVIICSAILSVLCAFFGIIVSILGGTPVGSTIVAVDIAAFLVTSLIGKLLER